MMPQANRISPVTVAPFWNCALAVAMAASAWFARGALAQETKAPSAFQSPVGMPFRVEQIVFPGSELEPVPVNDKTLIVVRIDAVYPHGSAFRYDLVCYGVEPGEYDLRQFLKRKDGSSTDDLPSTPISILAQLPPGQIEPHTLEYSSIRWLGGYRLILILGGIMWGAGLVWLLYPRRKPTLAVAQSEQARPVSLADRLRPLVLDAVAGKLTPAQLAELERALVSHWRNRLGLNDQAPVEALSQLRQHPEAGPLIVQLETWLHRPGGSGQVDVPALLEPYRNVAGDALSMGGG
jgi:hypothetical protein